ncbi:hypothetical protein A2U01_0047660 [Trifolium medium]|uniref:Uncharacterized protein n=1 Tax=Trifolium medium TaxID=97028 RepID=A0A392QTA3_9FABA|nr:hypothetical protein [Trifolium medium]
MAAGTVALPSEFGRTVTAAGSSSKRMNMMNTMGEKRE